MTCIRFFTHQARSYLQLGEQQVPPLIFSRPRPHEHSDKPLPLVQRWLVRAKEHLKTYLQEQQGRSGGRRRSQGSSFRKMMSSSDVSRCFGPAGSAPARWRPSLRGRFFLLPPTVPLLSSGT